MTEALVVGRANDYGLKHDADILIEALATAGAASRRVGRRPGLAESLLRRETADFAFHLERVFRPWRHSARVNFLVPNQERFPRRQLPRLACIDRVLAKTHHAHAVFSDLGVATSYLGFASRDRRDPSVVRRRDRVLHLAGGSTLKGSEDILAVWARHPEWPPLILVQRQANAPSRVPPNVDLRAGYMDDAELRRLQNACAIHLCPSRSEGWGHYLVEAMACGAVVVTTDAPPMNEHVTSESGFLVPVARAEERHLGTNYFIDPDAFETAVASALAMSPELFELMSRRARAAYEKTCSGFAGRLVEQLAA